MDRTTLMIFETVFLFAFLTSSRTALAAYETTAQTSSRTVEIDRPYNPTTALLLSLIPTSVGVVTGTTFFAAATVNDNEILGGIGIVTTAGALALGPSIGHFYVRNVKQGVLSISVSPVLSIGTVTCIAIGIIEVTNIPALWFTLGIVTFGGDIAFTVYNIATAPRAAYKSNEALRKRPDRFSILPAVFKTADNKPNYGIKASASF
ncbi:MAG: hypothetical protein GY854_33055 [Deltaproteobacteria bacterium]|nr:hypothetical protein [Deltaproteobacteria bacterium]